MVKVYVAGPYRAKTLFGVLLNIRRAWSCAKKLWALNFAVLCPHTCTIFMSEFKRSIPAGRIMKGELELLLGCDVVLMMDGWQHSEGSIVEKEWALEHGIPVCYDIDDLVAHRKEWEWRRV